MANSNEELTRARNPNENPSFGLAIVVVQNR